MKIKSTGSTTLRTVLLNRVIAAALGCFAVFASMPAISITIDSEPLYLGGGVPGNLVLVPSVEWPTVVTHANDPGKGDGGVTYSNATAYAGYFNPDLCYDYHYDAKEENRYFYPFSVASGRQCSNGNESKLWSGNFLNWASMQAVDTFRLALTGGYRVNLPSEGTPASVSITGADGQSHTLATGDQPGSTYLEKGNSDRWDVTYTKSRRLDSARSSAPLAQINTRIAGLRNQMWFTGSNPGNKDKYCTENSDYKYYSNLGCGRPYYDPKALGLPVVDGSQAEPGGAHITAVPYDPDGSVDKNKVYSVSIRVKVCDGRLDMRDMCTMYGSNYKPEGLLQKNASKIRFSLFSYLAQSGQSRDGGVMRARQKFIGPVLSGESLYPDRNGRIAGVDNPEWDARTGVLINNPDATDAAVTSSRIGSCTDAPDKSNCKVQFSGIINYINRFGQINTGFGKLKEYDNLSEMYYTALLYLRGRANNSSFSALKNGALANYQYADGFPVIEDWYGTGANIAVKSWVDSNINVGSNEDPMLYRCQTTATLGIGDTSTNNEDNNDGRTKDSGLPSDVWQGYTEFSTNNGRGNFAGLAYWAHMNDLRSDIPNMSVASSATNGKRGQTISTYWVDVVERSDLLNNNTNQFYNATKYGGYPIPDEDWGADGNAARHDKSWFDSHTSAWTSSTQTVHAATGLTNGNYYLPLNMFLANNGQAMIDGLTAAFKEIVSAATGSGAALATNTTKLEAGAQTYQARFITGNNNEWGGELVAYNVNNSTGALTKKWAATENFPLWGPTNATTDGSSGGKARQIFYNNDAGSLSAFQDTVSGLSEEQVNYIRGDRSKEESNGGIFRNRESVLGDIVDSQPVYVGAPSSSLYANQSFTGASAYAAYANSKASRTKVVYVGANDGMLHAFNADTGRELFAFIPQGALSKLADYTSPDYEHEYSVDGDLTVADAYIDGAWKTILVGTMGRGGKNVFALDVTDPANPTLLWEKNGTDPLGNNLGQPVIAQVADGDWRVLLGNGPNSSSGHAQLVMISLSDGSIDSVDTGVGGDNGLSGVNAWSSTGNGIVDTVYAGDLKGNLWKFNNPAAGGSVLKLFAAGDSKPITSTPLVAVNPNTLQTWVWFGTGRYLNSADIADTNTQTWYGLIDGSTTISAGNLSKVSMLAEGEVSGTLVRTLNSYNAAGVRGWYFDLPDTGERMVVANEFVGELLEGVTRIPNSSDVCSPGGTGYTMLIDPFTGGRSDKIIFDINGDGVFDDKDTLNGMPVSGIGHSSGPAGSTTLGDYMYTTLDNGTTEVTKVNSASSDITRVSWRELIRE